MTIIIYLKKFIVKKMLNIFYKDENQRHYITSIYNDVISF